MNNEIQVFTNQLLGSIRTINMGEENLYFCLNDVTEILGLSSDDARKRIKHQLDEFNNISTLGGLINTPGLENTLYTYIPTQVQTGIRQDGTPILQTVNMLYISEPALYHTIFQSRKPEAKIFQLWVYKEVLPTMRKIGFNESIQLLQEELQKKEELIRILQLQNNRVGDISLSNTVNSTERKYLENAIICSPYLTDEQKIEMFKYDPSEYNPEYDLDYSINIFKNKYGLL